ncbi:glutamate synthase central domain-containing protein [Escherichia coli]
MTSLKPRSKRQSKSCATKPKKWYVAAPCCWCSPTGISLKIACRFQPQSHRAIQTRLVDQSLRCDANIIVETASARRDPHHFAVLLGFGATAI